MPLHLPNKTFFFVRHGVTHANKQQLWCGGDWDIDLHPEGEQQALSLADKITEIAHEFENIFVSPMLRARQTMHLLNSKSNKPHIVVEELREWRIGIHERIPWSEFQINKNINEWPTPIGGETIPQFRERVKTALTYCLTHTEKPLLVAHGAVGRAILDILDLPEQEIHNCQLLKFSSRSSNRKTIWDLKNYSI